MNPLQYLPVVGTLYRALTGDVIPEALRRAGSMVVSGLLGGPVGLLMNIAVTIAEKITDIDPEKIVAAQFHRAPPAAAAVETPAATSAGNPMAASARMPAGAPEASASARLALTPQQLAAYGVRVDPSGNLKLGDVEGADVLNVIELARLGRATAAYAVNQAMPLTVAVRSR
jgi:hypothetical protein